MKIPVRTLGAAWLGLCLSMAVAHASVLITGTRVVFPAQDGEVTVRLTNDADRPALVESWVDAGDAQSTPDRADTPFLVTPPLFRMEAHRDQSLRILFTPGHQALPADRESLFWLNVLEVPPKPSTANAGANYLQLAIRSRLKLFYRPAGLTADPQKAPDTLTFELARDGAGYAVTVHNPSPYHITLTRLRLHADGTSYAGQSGMVAPLSDLRVALPGLTMPPPAGSVVEFVCINDYGAAVTFQKPLAPR
ncbi:molecular chaperone [Fulvimonas yonginensis]|uniref:Molecular chaperone n=1 Tax=Fulvimonas yonginensis TaxID=1495200 RepID=A0ABU8J8B1_9GAMM